MEFENSMAFPVCRGEELIQVCSFLTNLNIV